MTDAAGGISEAGDNSDLNDDIQHLIVVDNAHMWEGIQKL